MLTIVLRRLIALPAVLLAVLTVSFILLALVPGSLTTGERAIDSVSLANRNARLGLDLHPVHRYFWYLGKLARGDLGFSPPNQDRPVSGIIAEHRIRVGPFVNASHRVLLVGVELHGLTPQHPYVPINQIIHATNANWKPIRRASPSPVLSSFTGILL